MRLLTILLPFLSLLLHGTPIEIGEGDYTLEPDTSVVYKTVTTPKGEVELMLHGFLPKEHKATESKPAALFFHGGGWQSGKTDQFYPQCRYLALRGIPAYSASYRLIKRHQTTPRECVEDGKSAFRWLRQNAPSLGIDPDKIALGGGSAGGHIAAAIALCDGFNAPDDDLTVSTTPAALILYNPVFDNSPQGFGHALVKDYWQEISPLHNIDAQAPPSIVMLGDQDKLLPVATVERYQRELQEHKIPCTVHVFPGRKHAFFNLWTSKANLTQTLIQVDAFLVSLGLLSGPPLFPSPAQ